MSTCINDTDDGHTVGPEQCDDGNMINGDGCSGNLIDYGWTCKLDMLLKSICVRFCGNGIIDFTGEVCDDGNIINGDGCNLDC